MKWNNKIKTCIAYIYITKIEMPFYFTNSDNVTSSKYKFLSISSIKIHDVHFYLIYTVK